MSISQEGLLKFVLLILFSLLIVYISSNLINNYFVNDTFFMKLGKILLASIIVFIIMLIIIHFEFKKTNLLNSFNVGFSKNLYFLIFFTIYIYIFKYIQYLSNWNNKLSDILSPMILGLFLLFFIFCILIFLSLKLKIIDNKQYLNAFIGFSSIAFFLGFIQIYIFMTSLSGICEPNNNQVTSTETSTETNTSISKNTLINMMIISLVVILWLDDSRNWHQIGSILFILATIITLTSMFYYSTIYPSISLLSFWLFIEWIIIIFRKRENSKNSMHFTFMKT